MVGQTKYLRARFSSDATPFQLQFMGRIYRTLECLTSQGWVTVSSGSARGVQSGEIQCLHSILEVTGCLSAAWFPVAFS